MGKKRELFAISPSGELFVDAAAVLGDCLVACYDGLEIAIFGNDGHPYLAIDTAIEWTSREVFAYPASETESKRHKKLREGYLAVLKNLEYAKDKHSRGELVEVN